MVSEWQSQIGEMFTKMSNPKLINSCFLDKTPSNLARFTVLENSIYPVFAFLPTYWLKYWSIDIYWIYEFRGDPATLREI